MKRKWKTILYPKFSLVLESVFLQQIPNSPTYMPYLFNIVKRVTRGWRGGGAEWALNWFRVRIWEKFTCKSISHVMNLKGRNSNPTLPFLSVKFTRHVLFLGLITHHAQTLCHPLWSPSPLSQRQYWTNLFLSKIWQLQRYLAPLQASPDQTCNVRLFHDRLLPSLDKDRALELPSCLFQRCQQFTDL